VARPLPHKEADMGWVEKNASIALPQKAVHIAPVNAPSWPELLNPRYLHIEVEVLAKPPFPNQYFENLYKKSDLLHFFEII
jgi:hypothetical protein